MQSLKCRYKTLHTYIYFKELNKYTHTLHNAKLFGVVGELKLDCTWSPVHCSVHCTGQSQRDSWVEPSALVYPRSCILFTAVQCSAVGRPKGQLSWVRQEVPLLPPPAPAAAVTNPRPTLSCEVSFLLPFFFLVFADFAPSCYTYCSCCH